MMDSLTILESLGIALGVILSISILKSIFFSDIEFY